VRFEQVFFHKDDDYKWFLDVERSGDTYHCVWSFTSKSLGPGTAAPDSLTLTELKILLQARGFDMYHVLKELT
jgi:hypothetical protein